MVALIDIFYTGNGFRATFDDDTVAEAVYTFKKGSLVLEGLSDSQKNALENFTLNIPQSTRKFDPRFNPNSSNQSSFNGGVNVPSGVASSFGSVTIADGLRLPLGSSSSLSAALGSAVNAADRIGFYGVSGSGNGKPSFNIQAGGKNVGSFIGEDFGYLLTGNVSSNIANDSIMTAGSSRFNGLAISNLNSVEAGTNHWTYYLRSQVNETVAGILYPYISYIRADYTGESNDVRFAIGNIVDFRMGGSSSNYQSPVGVQSLLRLLGGATSTGTAIALDAELLDDFSNSVTFNAAVVGQFGYYGTVSNFTNDLKTIYIQSQFGGGTVGGDLYDIHIYPAVSANMTVSGTQYGIKIEDVAAGANNYAIHTGAGEVYFGDKVTSGDSSIDFFIDIEASDYLIGSFFDVTGPGLTSSAFHGTSKASADGTIINGISGTAVAGSGFDSAAVSGMLVSATVEDSASVNNLGASSVLAGVGVRVNNSIGSTPGTIANAVGTDIGAFLNAGTFINVIGSKIVLSVLGSTTTNAYGLKIEDIANATNNYAIHTGAGINKFGDLLEFVGIAAPAVSNAGECRIYFDSSTNKLRISENGGAYVNVV